MHACSAFIYIFLIFAQTICEAVPTCTHNLSFGAKIRKMVYPSFVYKRGVQGGIYFTDMFS